MKPIDLFTVIIRTVGLLVSLTGSARLFWGLLNLVLGGPASVSGMLIVGIPMLSVGLWLLRLQAYDLIGLGSDCIELCQSYAHSLAIRNTSAASDHYFLCHLSQDDRRTLTCERSR